MSTAILDDQRRITIPAFDETMEIKANGEVVGRFVPEAEYQKMLYSSAEWACPFTREELEHSFSQPGGSSLAEFWKRMGVK
jgi:hypothetical protein